MFFSIGFHPIVMLTCIQGTLWPQLWVLPLTLAVQDTRSWDTSTAWLKEQNNPSQNCAWGVRGCSNLSTTSFIKVITLCCTPVTSCFLCLQCVHVSLCSCRVNVDLVQMLMIHLKSPAQPASCESGTTKTHRRATDLHGSDHDKYPCNRPSAAPVTPAF